MNQAGMNKFAPGGFLPVDISSILHGILRREEAWLQPSGLGAIRQAREASRRQLCWHIKPLQLSASVATPGVAGRRKSSAYQIT